MKKRWEYLHAARNESKRAQIASLKLPDGLPDGDRAQYCTRDGHLCVSTYELERSRVINRVESAHVYTRTRTAAKMRHDEKNNLDLILRNYAEETILNVGIL